MDSESEGGSAGLDATRRTRLANERTYLAWWRTALAAFGLSVAIGALLPALTPLSRWALLVLGSGFAVFGVWLIIHGHRRHAGIERALDRGEYLPLSSRLTAVLVVGVVLGVSTLALLLYVALR